MRRQVIKSLIRRTKGNGDNHGEISMLIRRPFIKAMKMFVNTLFDIPIHTYNKNVENVH